MTNDNIFTAYAAMLAQGRKADKFYKTISSAKALHFSYKPELIKSMLFRLQKLDGSARSLANQIRLFLYRPGAHTLQTDI